MLFLLVLSIMAGIAQVTQHFAANPLCGGSGRRCCGAVIRCSGVLALFPGPPDAFLSLCILGQVGDSVQRCSLRVLSSTV